MITRRQLCTAALLAPALAAAPQAARAAGDVQLMQARLWRVRGGEQAGLYLSASWEFDLSDALLQSLNHGIALYFVTQFRLVRERWYWSNRTEALQSIVTRVNFSPLAQRYRVSQGGLTQSFSKLDYLLPVLKNTRDWRVAEPSELEALADCRAQVRMLLDTTRLPKPLQVSIGGNSDWSLDSEWQDVEIKPAVAAGG
ncbi:MAG: DUF4390 domain-containing protein [Duodenibacillus sp.]|nr:DUF4390 domain-containing protein [Duodenibacillus sp.]